VSDFSKKKKGVRRERLPFLLKRILAFEKGRKETCHPGRKKRRFTPGRGGGEFSLNLSGENGIPKKGKKEQNILLQSCGGKTKGQ